MPGWCQDAMEKREKSKKSEPLKGADDADDWDQEQHVPQRCTSEN